MLAKLSDLLTKEESFILRSLTELFPSPNATDKHVKDLTVCELGYIFFVIYPVKTIVEEDTTTVALAYNLLAKRAMEKNIPIEK